MTEMQLGRRDLLKIGGIGAAVAAAGLAPCAAQAAAATIPATVILYDAQFAAARSMAASDHGFGRSPVPLEGDRWQFARTHLRGPLSAVAGYTSWADFVFLSGMLQERGMRVHAQSQPAAQGQTLFAWIAR